LKKVLILSYYWPPASGPGVQRFLKMTKYFKDFGWKPFVLTTHDGTYPSMDESLLKEVDNSVKVYRTKPKEVFTFYNRLTGKKDKRGSVGFIGMYQKGVKQKLAMYIRANYFIPDARKGWNKTALPEAREIIRKENIEALITTGPPHSTHLMGLKLIKEFNLKWVADMRDPWVNVYYNSIFPRTQSTITKDQKLETEVLKSADVVSVVSNGLKKEFEDRAKKIDVVYNGFEENDFIDNSLPVDDKFVISYIGNFKPNQDVPVFWKALSELTFNKPELRKKLVLRLTGNIHPQVIESIKEAGMESCLELNDFVSHREAIAQMKSSNLLLFIIPKTDGNEKILTGKLFEYLASETQLFSIGPVDGDAAKILQECGRMKMIDYADLNSMKEKVFQRRVNGVSLEYMRYTRREQARKLLSLLS